MQFVNLKSAPEEMMAEAKALLESAGPDPMNIFKHYARYQRKVGEISNVSEAFYKMKLKTKVKHRDQAEKRLAQVPQVAKPLLVMKLAYEIWVNQNGSQKAKDYDVYYRGVVGCWNLLNMFEGNFRYYLDLIDGKPTDDPQRYNAS